MTREARLRAQFIAIGLFFLAGAGLYAWWAYHDLSWSAIRFAGSAAVTLLCLLCALMMFFMATVDDLSLSKKNDGGDA